MIVFLKQRNWYAPAVRTARTFVQALLGITIAKWMANIVGDPKVSVLWATLRSDWDPIIGMSLTTCLPAWLMNLKRPVNVEVSP